MKVKVFFFAQLKDAFGQSERIVEVKKGATVAEVKALLATEDSKKLMQNLPMLYAVNEDYVSPETTLVENDVVAFLPPMAGG